MFDSLGPIIAASATFALEDINTGLTYICYALIGYSAVISIIHLIDSVNANQYNDIPVGDMLLKIVLFGGGILVIYGIYEIFGYEIPNFFGG